MSARVSEAGFLDAGAGEISIVSKMRRKQAVTETCASEDNMSKCRGLLSSNVFFFSVLSSVLGQRSVLRKQAVHVSFGFWCQTNLVLFPSRPDLVLVLEFDVSGMMAAIA